MGAQNIMKSRILRSVSVTVPKVNTHFQNSWPVFCSLNMNLWVYFGPDPNTIEVNGYFSIDFNGIWITPFIFLEETFLSYFLQK